MKRDKEKPAYMQLYQKVREEIVEGVYAYGTKIPSKRNMSLETGTSLITVEHAYDLLAEEGYIESRERSGYFVIYRSEDLFSVAEGKRKDLTHALSKDVDAFPHTTFASAVRKALADHEGDILSPTDGCGCYEVRRAIAGYLGRSRGMYVEPKQIVIGAGSEYLYSLVMQLLGHHRIYGLEDPSYEKILQIYQAGGVRCDMLKMGKNGILSSELKRTPASVLHVTPYHSYPSGMSADISKKQEYIRWVRKNDRYIVEDDYDSEFTVSMKMQETLFSMEPDSSVIYMNTFTRTIGPSLRVGYMVLPKEKCDIFLHKIAFRSCTVSALVQYVLAELLDSGSFERHINRIRRKKRKQVKK